MLTVSNGAEAIEMYAQHASEIALLLTDMMMPVMDGPTAIQALSRLNPNLKVIAASGLSPEIHMARTPNDTVKAFLPKPYSTEMLLTTVHGVLAANPANPPTGLNGDDAENFRRTPPNGL